MKKILLSVLCAVAVITAAVAWFVTRTPASPFDGVIAGAAPIPVEQGEYVARLADCVACHSTPGGRPFAGGLEMGTPLGSIFTTNITPDPETGIGNYTLAQFDNAVRKGIAADGRRLYPAMPYPSYAKMSDDDIRALYDYFKNNVQPVRQQAAQSDIPWPLNMRWPLALWNLAFSPSATYRNDPQKDEVWNRGAYLVEGPGHCGSCHTPRATTMQEVSYDSGSNSYLSGALLDGWYAPSIRNGHNVGLGRWSEEEIVTYLKNGRNRHGVVFGSMMEAFNNSTQFMTDRDLQGIARYLKSLSGDPVADQPRWTYNPATTELLNGRDVDGTPGARTYQTRCGFCHGRDGMGRGEYMPPLAGASSLLAKYPDSAINIVLNGAGRVVSNGVPDSFRMPSFRTPLDDKEIAALTTFLRSSWGNGAAAVTPEQVKALREHTDPASDDVIILQMR